MSKVCCAPFSLYVCSFRICARASHADWHVFPIAACSVFHSPQKSTR
jgi:hypothetical protein